MVPDSSQSWLCGIMWGVSSVLACGHDLDVKMSEEEVYLIPRYWGSGCPYLIWDGINIQSQDTWFHQLIGGAHRDGSKMDGVTALLFPSYVFCSVFVGMQTGCLNHKSPTIWSVTCSAWAPLYGWSQVSSDLHYTVVSDISSAELSLLQEHLVGEWINGQRIDY